MLDDNGVHLINWYFILMIIDVIIGFVKSAVKGRLHSRTYLKGIAVKMLAISGIVVGNMLDDLFNNYLNIHLGIDISTSYTIGLLVYEGLSIVENLRAMSVFTGKLEYFINKILDITEKTEKVKDKKENDKNGKSK
nr:phage holin family protein [Lactobacillus sp. S2-2]